MDSDTQRFLACPACESSQLRSLTTDSARLACGSCGREWPVRDGIPDLTFPDDLREEDSESRTFWNRIARFYDGINVVTGLMRGVSTTEERRALVAGLGLEPGSAVLEIATGTGRNLAPLTEAVGENGLVFGLDLSAQMLSIASKRAGNLNGRIQLMLANSQHLPYPDDSFDAVLDGAGIKYYPDKGRAMREMLRVVRPGGKVLITELGMPSGQSPTLRQRSLLLWIPGFREGPPMDLVPPDATDVQLNWDSAQTYFALEFRKAADPAH